MQNYVTQKKARVTWLLCRGDWPSQVAIKGGAAVFMHDLFNKATTVVFETRTF